MKENWWIYLLQAIALFLLGVLILSAGNAASLLLITQFLGWYWFFTGTIYLAMIFADKKTKWYFSFIKGFLGIAAGVLVINHPLQSAVILPTVLILILGIQGFILGFIGILEGASTKDWGSLAIGVVNLIFGIILLANPFVAAFITPFVIGMFAIAGSLVTLSTAFKVKNQKA